MNSFKYILLLAFLIIAIKAVYSQESETEESFEASVSGDGESTVTVLDHALNGDIEGLLRAVESGADLSVVNVNGWSSAMFAVGAGHLDVLHVLIDHGVDVNMPDVDGFTPLMLAAQQGDKEIVEALFAAGADPTYVANNGETVRSISKAHGRPIISLLVAEGSAVFGIVNQIPELVLESVKDGAFVEITSGSGWTPLICASASGNVAIVKELIDLNADLNRSESDGWTPLHFASVNGFETVVDVLLAAGATPDLASADGKTPKDLAEQFNFPAIAAKLASASSAKEL